MTATDDRPALTWDEPMAMWFFGETPTHLVHICPMIFNHRVVLSPKRSPKTYDVGWCYPDLESAVSACQAWAHTGYAGQPGWFIKRVGSWPL